MYPAVPSSTGAPAYVPLDDPTTTGASAPPLLMAPPQPMVMQPQPMMQPMQPQPMPMPMVVITPAPMAAMTPGGLMVAMPPPMPAPTPSISVVAFNGDATATVRRNAIGVILRQPLSNDWPCFLCCPLWAVCSLAQGRLKQAFKQLTCQSFCDYICWSSKLAPRSYAAVHENRIEFNYASTACCGCCVDDSVEVIFFDQVNSLEHVTCCSPYHCCCCIECYGGVVALAPCACLNSCCCPCCRRFYPGLSNAAEFARVAKEVKATFDAKQRIMTRD